MGHQQRAGSRSMDRYRMEQKGWAKVLKLEHRDRAETYVQVRGQKFEAKSWAKKLTFGILPAPSPASEE